MNVVSFCLYGKEPKYCQGLLCNAWLVQTWYPGWEMHVWVDRDVPDTYLKTLVGFGAHLHPMDGRFRQRMFYRFLAHDLPGVERYIVRDADSRIGAREASAVKEWIVSGKLLHTMHDHPYHIMPIQGGMFGLANPTGCMSDIVKQSGVADVDKWGKDQEFLSTIAWPHWKKSVIEHGRAIPFPCRNEDPESFVGEVYDEHGRPQPNRREIRNAQWNWK